MFERTYIMINSTYCTAAMASLTYAMKAQRIMSAAGLHSDIVKLDSSRTKRGCAYGLQFECDQTDRVRRILREGGVTVREYLMGGGDLL